MKVSANIAGYSNFIVFGRQEGKVKQNKDRAMGQIQGLSDILLLAFFMGAIVGAVVAVHLASKFKRERGEQN